MREMEIVDNTAVASAPRNARCSLTARGLPCPWGKDRALARLADYRDISAQHARELAGDRKPQPGAAETLHGRGFGLGGFLEQLRTCSAVTPIPVSDTANSIH